MPHLITGGAGFIGTNLAHTLLARGEQVTIFDNLSRPRTPLNLAWLQAQHGERLRFIQADLRDFAALQAAVVGHEVIYHLGGQVAVTTSVANPREDFMINALGTFNVLEAARLAPTPPIVFYASTNKVYGGMEHVPVVEHATRYMYRDLPKGVGEEQLLDFHSPYGVSKGAGDQYVRDYARIYGLKTVVFRQSCIYGPRQFGVEDQGWAAHFVIAAVMGRPLTIYGDGKQVRDMLYVDDLIAAYLAALERIDQVSGQIYNIGGGPSNALSIWAEFGPLLERLVGRQLAVTYGPWRPGDQPVYVSAIDKAARELGWQPQVSVAEGMARLVAWVKAQRELFE
ncbi:NAD-dependent epimerase/dehydratase family protein [Candidatus Viridilinea mediisalina]|uniref:CDP-paratose 2-epimerase n=1 Tax=Candidatus Viridilinea mediisalina TaxID=2024553 RepID=A0A2A6RH77_9CHLR|nr:NAD-dependent epimerase/dehydratase family protein [Candidatus Viridilinea mediisalina]PDW02246.1 CDP-paratose 2-epimerase [Candidatus Viridilinea mediisalina]